MPVVANQWAGGLTLVLWFMSGGVAFVVVVGGGSHIEAVIIPGYHVLRMT